MSNVHLHVDDEGSWLMTVCPACGSIHKYPLQEAARAPVACKTCGHLLPLMDSAAALMKDAGTPDFESCA